MPHAHKPVTPPIVSFQPDTQGSKVGCPRSLCQTPALRSLGYRRNNCAASEAGALLTTEIDGSTLRRRPTTAGYPTQVSELWLGKGAEDGNCGEDGGQGEEGPGPNSGTRNPATATERG